MRIYVHWKYTHKINLSMKNLPSSPDLAAEVQSYPHLVLRALLWFYVACDMFLEDDAKNAAIDEIARRADTWKNGCIFTFEDHIKYVWDNTAPGSKLRTYLLDDCMVSSRSERLRRITDCPPEFILDFAVRLAETRGYSGPQALAVLTIPCRYHDHVNATTRASRLGGLLGLSAMKRPRSGSESGNDEDDHDEPMHVRSGDGEDNSVPKRKKRFSAKRDALVQ
ncbi:hypothetical protein LTR10_011074 [Elasticomyces elasticus]|nr:hypothetical protein LTR10_011074 [Elasticomyces elasticus]KAK4966501.1 hypothetical protein LTR42_011666 [Elasticomyces elasticus]